MVWYPFHSVLVKVILLTLEVVDRVAEQWQLQMSIWEGIRVEIIRRSLVLKLSLHSKHPVFTWIGGLCKLHGRIMPSPPLIIPTLWERRKFSKMENVFSIYFHWPFAEMRLSYLVVNSIKINIYANGVFTKFVMEF